MRLISCIFTFLLCNHGSLSTNYRNATNVIKSVVKLSDVQFIRSRNECFVLVRLKKSWIDAQFHCHTLGGNLATVTNDDELAALNCFKNKSWIGFVEEASHFKASGYQHELMSSSGLALRYLTSLYHNEHITLLTKLDPTDHEENKIERKCFVYFFRYWLETFDCDEKNFFICQIVCRRLGTGEMHRTAWTNHRPHQMARHPNVAHLSAIG